VNAFRASLRADPSLIPAYIALASTLYDFERTSYLGDVGSPLDFLFKLPPQSERVASARDLWLKVLRLPGRDDSVANLGSAYYGLCRQASRQGRRLARLSLQQGRSHPPEPWSLYYMAYYYCKRAEAQYASLATTQYTNPEIKKAEAYVLQNLGVILANFQPPKRPSEGDQSGWECWATKLEANLNSREGLQFFLRALDLLPEDYRIRCYAARAAYASGNPELLERLQADPAAHLNLANSHRRLARVCASMVRLSPDEYGRLEQTSYRRYIQLCKGEDAFSTSAEHYQLALDEYNEVIRYEPMNIEALTGYADTVWERLINASNTEELRSWIAGYPEQALRYARQAAAFSSVPPAGTMPAMIQATLGKAFLAQGEPKFAIEELKKVVARVPDHPAYYEIHWALAQAYVCAASIDKHLGVGDEDVELGEKLAVKLRGDIHQQERTREFQLYSARPGVLGSPWGTLICDPKVGMERMPDPSITLPATLTSTTQRKK
jgi:tetratricopeptide (TPR) repeat protein